MKLKTNLFLINALVVTLAIGFATFLFLSQIQAEAVRLATAEEEEAIRTFWKLLRDKGTDFRVENGRLMAGSYVTNGNNELPDTIRDIFGGTATIFMGDTRVATNVPAADGSRAIGTRLQGPAYDAIFKENRPYRGEAPILGTTYFTAYDPIRDKNGKTIGVLYVGVKKGEFLADFSHLKRNMVAGTVIIEVIVLGLAAILLQERHRNVQALRRSEERYHRLFSTMMNGFALFEVVPEGGERFADLRYLEVNDAHALHTGLPRDLVLGKTLRQLFPGEDDAWFRLIRELSTPETPRQVEIFFTPLGKWLEMAVYSPNEGQVAIVFADITARREAEDKIQQVAQVLSATTGVSFFASLTENLAQLLQADMALIGELTGDAVRVIASFAHGAPGETFTYALAGTPCAEVVSGGAICFYPEGVARRFPDNRLLADVNAEGFLGVPLKLADGRIVGVLAVVDSKPLRRRHDTEPIVRLFAERAAAELNRLKDEANLREMADQLRLITDSVPVLIAYVDAGLCYRFVNSGYEAWFGLGRDRITGRSIEEMHGADFLAGVRGHIDAVLAGESVTFVNELENEGGGTAHLQASYVPHRLDSGEVVGFFALITDITAERTAQQALRDSEAFLQTMIDTIPSPIFYKDRSGRYLGHNQAFEAYLGLSRDELIGKTVFDIAPPDLAQTYHAMDEALFAAPGIQVYEASVLYADGSRHEVVFNKATFADKDGRIGGMVGVILDVTDQKRLMEALRVSEERYRTVFETTGSAMIIIEADTTISLANRQFAALSGYSTEEIEGKMSWVDFVATTERERMLAYHRQRRIDPSDVPATYEFRFADRGGTLRDIMTTVAMIPGTDKSVHSYLDITGLKQTERLLAGEKGVLELIVRDIPLVDVLKRLCENIEELAFGALCSILLVDESGSHLRHAAAPSLPAAFCASIDGTRIGMNVGSCGTAAFTGRQVIASDLATDPRWAKYWKLPLSYGLRSCWSLPILSSGGTVLGTFAVYYTRVRTPEPSELQLVERAVHLASIVIERKRAAETLRQVQLQQQAILDNIPDLIWMKDHESRFIIVNKAFAAACSSTPDQLRGKTDCDIWPPDLAAKYRQDDQSVMASASQTLIEEEIARTDGRRRWSETIKMPVYDDQGKLIGTTGIARDIHERKRTEDALRESEERFHQIFTQNDDAIALVRLDTFAIIDANPAAEGLTGYSREELQRAPFSAFIDPEDFRALVGMIPHDDYARAFQVNRSTVTRKDGAAVFASIRCKIVRLREEYVIHCSLRDMTEKLRLEEEILATQAKLIHTNKMTSIGMLASSVAHEINNPNNCISVNASMLNDVWRDAEPVLYRFHAEHGEFSLRGLPFTKMLEVAPRLFNGILEGSRRISTIVNNMRDFVREDKSGLNSCVDINRLVLNAASILWHHIHTHTDNYRSALQEGLPPARGNAQQLEQVVINLLVNALQALPAKSYGVFVATSHDREAGEIVVTVRDEGEGMSERQLARLREAFFTTRPGGTGLGLYITDSIVKEHHGTLAFDSEPGKGTTVTVRIPQYRVEKG